MKIQFPILLFSALLIMASCEKEDEGNERVISENFSEESHKTGQNCMECHFAGGSGEGWFTVAGSVFNEQLDEPIANGVIELTTESQSNGSIVASIEIDEKGNFYTTESIDFGEGLYATVKSQEGNKKYMLTKLTTGSCNSCHGSSTDKIWAD